MMKMRLISRGLLGSLLLVGGLASAQEKVGAEKAAELIVEAPNEKAARYHELLLKKPGNPIVFNRFVEAWLDTGSKAGLTDFLENSAKKGGAAEWQVLASLREHLGEDDATLMALDEAVKRAGGNATLFLRRARFQAGLLSFDAALADLEKAAADPRKANEAARLKGLFLARSGRIAEAVIVWQELVAENPDDEDLLESVIEVFVAEGLYREAIEACTKLVSLSSDPYQKALRQLRLSELFLLRDDRDDALKTYQKILSVTGEGTWLEREVLAQIERVFQREDDIRGLRAFYQTLRETYPRRVSIRKALARQMARNGELVEAVTLFREILKITPGDLGNREEFIAFLQENELWKEARTELAALVDLRINDDLLWERLARLESKLGNDKALKRALTKIADLRGEEAGGIVTTAALYAQLKLGEGAEKILRAGREKFPGSDEITEALAGRLMVNGKQEEALKIWLAMAKGAGREGILRVSRSLAAAGKKPESLALLLRRIGDFGNDPLILTQLCSLADDRASAQKVMPHALHLVDLAATPTELESSIRIALRVVKRADQEERLIRDLSAMEDAKIARKCLLAALHISMDDSREAVRILKSAEIQEKAEGGLLARFYRIRLEEMEGDFASAIQILREIIATPEGRKTVHLRRLVDLLEQADDLEGALVAVDEWKLLAPGDQSAWLRRARLLGALDRPDNAVVELRRMIGKFGADEDRRATLAAALIEAGDNSAAIRIYEQLYEESDRLESQLKWAGKLATLAEKEGRLEELLADFDRRKRRNPRAVAPLLAIAEIHRVLNRYEDRRAAMLEASRRRPDDTVLLTRIVKVEEKEGEIERAVEILREIARRDQTPASKRRLANFLLKNGEIRAGLEILGQLPDLMKDPRVIESVVLSLVAASEGEHALAFLNEFLVATPSDWRLQYLKGVILQDEGRVEEAFAQFLPLLEIDHELPGIQPLIAKNAKNHTTNYFEELPEGNGWAELQPYAGFIFRSPYHFGNFPTVQSPVRLPGSAKEVRILSILQGSLLLSKLPQNRRGEAHAALTLPGLRDLDLFVMLRTHADQPQMILPVLEARYQSRPDDLSLAFLYYNLKAGSSGLDSEDLKRAEKLLGVENPLKLSSILLSAVWQGNTSSAAIADILGRALKSVPKDKDKVNEVLGWYSSALFNGDPHIQMIRGNTAPIREVLADYALTLEDRPTNWGWICPVVGHLLHRKMPEEALILINRLCQWQEESKGKSGRNPVIGAWWFSSGNQLPARLSGPTFPPLVMEKVPAQLAALFPPPPSQNAGEDDPFNIQQLTIQGMHGEGGRFSGKEAALVLQHELHRIENSHLRALVHISLETGEEESLIAPMLASEDESDLRFAAGWYHRSNDPRGYAALLSLQKHPLSKNARTDLDRQIAFVAAQLINHEVKGLDLEPARRAALRLRRKTTGRDEQDRLIKILVTLGLEKEANRWTTGLKAQRAGGSSLGKNASHQQVDKITELAKKGNLEGAAREAAKQYRRGLNANPFAQQGEGFEAKLAKFKLVDLMLAQLDPGDSKSKKRRLEFAKAHRRFKKNETASRLYREILSDHPDLIEAMVGLALSTPFQELKDEEIVIRKDGAIDDEPTSRIIRGLWSVVRKPSEFKGWSVVRKSSGFKDHLRMCELTAVVLEELEPSDDHARDLSWAPHYLLQTVSDRSLINSWGTPLITNSLDEVSTAEPRITAFRNATFLRAFRAMLRHQQTSEQGFMLLHASREGLGLDLAHLIKLAQEAMPSMIATLRNRGPSYSGNNGLWNLNSGTGSPSLYGVTLPSLYGVTLYRESPLTASSPIDFLASQLVASGRNLFTPQQLTALAEVDPAKYRDFATALEIALVSHLNPAAADSAFQAWTQREKHLTSEKLITFAKQIILSEAKPGDWTTELDRLLAKHYREPSPAVFIRQTLSDHQFLNTWIDWRAKAPNTTPVMSFTKAFLEARLGPAEKWHLLRESDARFTLARGGRQFSEASSLFRSLLSHEALVRPTLALLGEHQLEGAFPNLTETIKEAWVGKVSSPSHILKNLVTKKLLHPSPDGKSPTPGYLLMLAEAISRIEFNRRSLHSQELADSLEKEAGLDPVLVTIARASLLPQEDAVKLILPFLEKNLGVIREMAAFSQPRTVALLCRWFPDLAPKSTSFETRAFFRKLADDSAKAEMAKLDLWIEEGIPGIAEMEAEAFWKMILKFARNHRDRAFQLSRRGLNDRLGRKSDRVLQQWERSLHKVAAQADLADTPLCLAILSDFYAGPFQDRILEPAAEGDALVWVWQAFLSSAQEKEKEEDVDPMRSAVDAAFDDWLGSLDQRGRALFAALTFREMLTVWNQPKSDDFESVKRYESLFQDRSPAFVNLAAVSLTYRNLDHQTRGGEALRLARHHFHALLTDQNLPVFIKAELLHAAADVSPEVLATPATFEAITQIIRDYDQPKRRLEKSTLHALIPMLADLECQAPPAVFAGLAEAAFEVLYQPAILIRRDTKEVENEEIIYTLVRLGIRGGRTEFVAQLIEKDIVLYRGRLPLMLLLAQSADVNLIRKLVKPSGGFQPNATCPPYDTEVHQSLQRLLNLLPENDRYLAEVLVASGEDAKAKPHPVNRRDRMVALAKDYKKRKPEARKFQLQCLARLSRSAEASQFLIDEFREATETFSLEDALFLASGEQANPKKSWNLSLIRRLIQMELAAGNYERIFVEIKSLQDGAKAGRTSEIAQEASDLFVNIARKLIFEAATDRKTARRIIPVHEKFFIQSLNFRDDAFRAIHAMNGAGLIIHALAGNEAGWKEVPTKLSAGQKEGYNIALGQENRSDPFRHLIDEKWRSPSSKPIREKVVRTLLRNQLYAEREVTYVHDMFGLSDHGFIPYEEVIAAIEELPEASSLKVTAMFHRAALKTYRVEGRTVESGLAAYDEAFALAEKLQDKITANQIRAHRCDVQFRNERKDEAKKNAALINLDLLPKRDQKWVTKEIKKWRGDF